MKNFDRRSSHGHHGSNRRELAQHAHSHESHAFIHTLTSTQLQPRGAKRKLSYYVSVHAWSFRDSVFHRTLTWAIGSLSCVLDHSCACVRLYTRGLGTYTASPYNIFDSEKPTHFSYAPHKSEAFLSNQKQGQNTKCHDCDQPFDYYTSSFSQGFKHRQPHARLQGDFRESHV